MRTAKVISISLPPDMTEEIQEIAREERRSVSEVFREALRRYAANRAVTAVRKEVRKVAKKKKVTPKQLDEWCKEARGK